MKYFLGLDIGTNSVGWAVTDEQYRLCQFKKKDMWGIRLFEDAQTAEERRVNRTTRRRTYRTKQRIDLLQELFSEEMAKVDPSFFIRLNESRLYREDKSTDFKHVLFVGDDYSDIDFHKDYPTFYHLRKALIEDRAPHDIRLLYLALHHIIKNRGHFLVSGDLSNVTDFSFALNQFKEEYHNYFDEDLDITDETAFENILKAKDKSKNDKHKILKTYINANTEDLDNGSQKASQKKVTALCKLMVGLKGNLKDIFGEDADVEEEFATIEFAKDNYEDEILPELEKHIPDETGLINAVQALYNWQVFDEVMRGEKLFSYAQVKSYEKHQKQLSYLAEHQPNLRSILKKYLTPQEYKTFFNDRSEKGKGYSHYIGHIKINGKKQSVSRCSKEDFYKELKKILEKIKKNGTDEADQSIIEFLISETDNQTLLPLQRSKDNSIVPKQAHEAELNEILRRCEKYFSFLSTKDEKGLSVSDKIKAIFNYRIPYYVGPLGENQHNANDNYWMVRKEEGRITPWNFKEKVDEVKSNAAFIERMTNKCTYLVGEDVLPKNSLLYAKFMVLNELNNLKIRGKAVTVKLKKDIYRDLFCQQKKVTGKQLLKYLQKDDGELDQSMLSGFDQDFKISLSSFIEMQKIFGNQLSDDQKNISENIIRWATIYGNDGKMLEAVVKNYYGDVVSAEQLKKIKKLRFNGWGNFSEKFLTDISGMNLETGERYDNILDCMWETNDNLMQVLSGAYDFRAKIDKINADITGEIKKFSYDELVKDLVTSPANKRAIWQTVQIVREIVKVMDGAPDKIFVEMARGGDKVKKRTESRKDKLIKLYEACDADVREWALKDIEARDEREFNSKKLFLYYCQMGRCAYSGEHISLEELMSKNSRWDIDHIYPQSKIKDDSLDNMVLAKKTINSEKSNKLLSPGIQKKMRGFWKKWLDCGLISKKKFDRLTRKGDFTDAELSGFAARQLVETRQSTKLVSELLERMYTDTKIVRVKAGWVSDFRQYPLRMLKSRRVNDYHHAKDAYLNIVAGNVYYNKFTGNPLMWVKKNKDKNWSINKVFYFDVKDAWDAPESYRNDDGKLLLKENEEGNPFGGTIDTVRKTMLQNNVLYTEYTYCETGALFDLQPLKKSDKGLIPLKKGLDPQKYGGYNAPKTAYFALVEFTDDKKNKRVKNITGVPIYVDRLLQNNPDALLEYFQNTKGKRDVKIIKPMIKKNSLIVVDGFPMRIRAENEKQLFFKSNMQLITTMETEESIRLIEKWLDKEKDRPKASKERFSMRINETFDGLNDALLDRVFNELFEKLNSKQYENRPGNQYKKLLDNVQGGKFSTLSLEEKAYTINELLTLLRCDINVLADLRDIKGPSKAGNMAKSKDVAEKSKVSIVHQSVTGLFQRKERL